MSLEFLRNSLNIPDLTDRKNGIHAINIALESISQAMAREFGIAVEEIRSAPEVTVRENFDDLLFPLDNLSRSSCYTRYVSAATVLRTHTTAAVPAWLQKLSQNASRDAMAIFPGMCFRRDVIDKKHCGQPHQLDVWRIRKVKPFDKDDLLHLVETITDAVIPGHEYRANDVVHPYTVGGLEIEIRVGDKWMELLECGLAHPTVLSNAGLNPKEYSGLALGLGLDRIVMIAKGIDDIRILRSTDSRIRHQMGDLEPFIPVSNQPPTKRVLSYSVAATETEEDVCEKIRAELNSESVHIEEIQYAEVPYDKLSDKARSNLGIQPNQKNVVITIIFRSLEGSLPKATVNGWIARLYPRLNEGEKGYY